NLEVWVGDTVQFSIQGSTCTNVNISGSGPIGNFNLTTGTPKQAIAFPSVGTYSYIITDNGQSPSQTSSSKVVTVIPHYVPSLSTWGIIILIGLIIITGAYLWIRRKPAIT
ncbi:MAG TPA: hypothetical protein VMT04_02495, partial [Terriglobales bacterium]|nr:hypothetical protein [Terriglobales bacterium]